MITKIAFLSRNLPSLFRRPPAVTSAGYSSPQERFLFAGVGFSAALHAAVLFGINPPAPPPPLEDELAAVAKGFWPEKIEIVVETPKPAATPEENKADKADQPAEAGENYARLPDLMRPPGPGEFNLTIDKLDIGKKPDPRSVRWDPPKVGPGDGGVTSKGPVFNRADLDKQPVATNRAAPRYPFEMRQLGMEGTVVLRFIVDSRGDVTDVEVIRSDRAEFSKAAVDAMLRWKFRPGMKDGRRVNSRMEMPMNFSLNTSA